jgi:hypothetical protein
MPNQKSSYLGRRFGRVLVLTYASRSSSDKIRVIGQCDCGNRKIFILEKLQSGYTKSCGCLRREVSGDKARANLLGKGFSRLLVLQRLPSDKKGQTVWLCLCECGNLTEVPTNLLTSNKVKSCGCLRIEFIRNLNRTHGLSKTKEYITFKSNKRRLAKINRTPIWSDLDRIRRIYENCPDGHHVDHIIPLKGKLVSGLHVPDNLQYLPARDNLSKGNSFSVST